MKEIRLFAMFFHENEYRHLITIYNFTFCGTILSNDVIKTSNWFYFLSNASCYIQINFRHHELISLGTTVENIHSKIKICKILHFIVFIMTSSKINQFFFMNQK